MSMTDCHVGKCHVTQRPYTQSEAQTVADCKVAIPASLAVWHSRGHRWQKPEQK